MDIRQVSNLDLQGEGIYSGHVHSDTLLPHGRGRMEYAPKHEQELRSYEGPWYWGSWQGEDGVLIFQNGDTYIGNFDQNTRHGQGLYMWEDGRCYEGQFCRNQRHGEGTFTFADGAVYTGEFCHGKRSGHGKYSFLNGNTYQGEWVNGEYEGYGVFTWQDGRIYRGEWRKSKYHGNGVEIDSSGQDIFDGTWENNHPAFEVYLRPEVNPASSRQTTMEMPVALKRLVTPPSPEVNPASSRQMTMEMPVALKRLVTPPSPYGPAQMLERPSVTFRNQELPSHLDVRSNSNSASLFPRTHSTATATTVTTDATPDAYGNVIPRPLSIRLIDRLSSRGDRPAIAPFKGGRLSSNGGMFHDPLHEEETKLPPKQSSPDDHVGRYSKQR